MKSFSTRSVVSLFMVCALPLAGLAADRDVVINEIMFHPPDDLEELQYVELFNRGQSAVDLSTWAFTKGINFTFAQNTRLAPESYLVVCRDKLAFAKHYGNTIAVIGNFSGKLSHRGERIDLSNARGELVDSVKYSDREPWPQGPDGYSASLERICPFASGKEADNWAGSALPTMRRSSGTPGRRNDTYSANLPPVISAVRFEAAKPGQPVAVTADVADADGVKTVKLLWRTPKSGTESLEAEVPMQRIAGDDQKGTYQAALAGQPQGTLVRFRLKAEDKAGAVRLQPSPNEPRPTYSYSTFINTNAARIAFAYVLNFARLTPERRYSSRSTKAPSNEPARGDSAFIYVPPGGGAVLTFDHVAIRTRSGGLKVHFQKDRPLKEMNAINVIFESSPRWVLAEPLAFELYRLAGVPAPLTEHVRVWMDGRLAGYHLLIEQPNKSFLARHKRDDTGNLYKLVWQGHGLVGQHEKKTHITKGSDDLVQVIEELDKRAGPAQWEFIRQNFNVEEFSTYYAVNQCLQNWDGFFNNYFAYHDTGGTGKWEMYPWDEDKTWGDYDGASPQYDWYEMPLHFGMRGAESPRWNPFSRGNQERGAFGGVSWWRPPGWFSGPLLANPEFRKHHLNRLHELCQTTFNEEKLLPIINALENRLEPEIPVRAQARGQNSRQALAAFHSDIQSFRNQVKFRRKFILDELRRAGVGRGATAPAARSLMPWIIGAAVGAGTIVGLVAWRRRLRRRRAVPPILPPPLPVRPPPLPCVTTGGPAAPFRNQA